MINSSYLPSFVIMIASTMNLDGQGVIGPQLLPCGGVGAYEISGYSENDKNVEWSIIEPNGGKITPFGVYRAPKKPGTFTIQGKYGNNPVKTSKITIHVLDQLSIKSKWEIELTRWDKWFDGKPANEPEILFNFSCRFNFIPEIVLDSSDIQTPNNHFSVQESLFPAKMEIKKSDGLSITVPVEYKLGRNRESKWVCRLVETDLTGANRIVFRINDKDGTIIWQTEQIEPSAEPDMELRRGVGNKFLYRIAKNWPYREGHPVSHNCYFSWDEGYSWQRAQSRDSERDGWTRFAIPELAFREISDPLVMMEATYGLFRRVRVARLSEILKSNSGRVKPEN